MKSCLPGKLLISFGLLLLVLGGCAKRATDTVAPNALLQRDLLDYFAKRQRFNPSGMGPRELATYSASQFGAWGLATAGEGNGYFITAPLTVIGQKSPQAWDGNWVVFAAAYDEAPLTLPLYLTLARALGQKSESVKNGILWVVFAKKSGLEGVFNQASERLRPILPKIQKVFLLTSEPAVAEELQVAPSASGSRKTPEIIEAHQKYVPPLGGGFDPNASERFLWPLWAALNDSLKEKN